MAQFALEGVVTMWHGPQAQANICQPNHSKTHEFASPSKLERFGYFVSTTTECPSGRKAASPASGRLLEDPKASAITTGIFSLPMESHA
jgi:hypothetical protein